MFGKERNRTKFTDIKYPRYRVFLGTDRYRFLRNRIYIGSEEPNRSIRYLSSAQANLALHHTLICVHIQFLFFSYYTALSVNYFFETLNVFKLKSCQLQSSITF
jgi:hypothetical protein